MGDYVAGGAFDRRGAVPPGLGAGEVNRNIFEKWQNWKKCNIPPPFLCVNRYSLIFTVEQMLKMCNAHRNRGDGA